MARFVFCVGIPICDRPLPPGIVQIQPVFIDSAGIDNGPDRHCQSLSFPTRSGTVIRSKLSEKNRIVFCGAFKPGLTGLTGQFGQ
jgi:hypothetical protein